MVREPAALLIRHCSLKPSISAATFFDWRRQVLIHLSPSPLAIFMLVTLLHRRSLALRTMFQMTGSPKNSMPVLAARPAGSRPTAARLIFLQPERLTTRALPSALILRAREARMEPPRYRLPRMEQARAGWRIRRSRRKLYTAMARYIFLLFHS